ncbi:hypothetical protein [Gandjariella thermophila]|uniref:hypothetical protein n=1 Tax=Gandjariella thermophila TaxID=1931992 RepID=UPI0010F88378|nr:hypothetical protein [Gandjariella thermophila]
MRLRTLLGRRKGPDPYAELRPLRLRIVFRVCAGSCGQTTWMPAQDTLCRDCRRRRDRCRAWQRDRRGRGGENTAARLARALHALI